VLRALAGLGAGAVLLSVVAVTADGAGALPCSPTTSDTCDGGDPGGGGGGGGGTTPLSVPSVYIAARTETTLTVGWFVDDTASARLETLDGGAWQLLTSSGPGGAASYENSLLARDSRHCYRVVARRGAQQKTSDTACGYTRAAGLFRNIWRVQVRVTTGDVDHGDTEDDVQVGVEGPVNGHSGGSTWLDADIDDFERGRTNYYDLVNLEGIETLDDIESIQLFKPGPDDWCVSNVALLVNDAPVFATNFADGCQWVNRGATETVQIGHEALRAYPLWPAYHIPLDQIVSGNYATIVISHDQLEGTIMSQVGDGMVDHPMEWGPPPDAVDLFRWDAQRAGVDLDLVAGGFDTDVDFDLVVGTHKDSAGQWFVDLAVQNARADVDVPLIFSMLSAGIEVDSAERQIEQFFSSVAQSMGIPSLHRVTASFDNSGNLVILGTIQCPDADPNHPGEICVAGNG
jgi:hypothetical protein